MKVCTFAGHADITQDEKNLIKPKLKSEIIRLIKKENVDTFYCGDRGSFDKLCSVCLKEIKNDYPFIKSFLVMSYMPGKKSESDLDPYSEYDGSIYPDLENTPPRFAIIKRNEWMICKSDFLITYITHKYGGAYRTLKYAKKKKHIQILYLYNCISEKATVWAIMYGMFIFNQ